MKQFFLLVFILPLFVNAQNYVDIFKVGYAETFNNNFENSESNTNVASFEASLTFPIVLNEKNALITGADISTNHLQLFPESGYTTLYSTNIKLGLASTLSKKWSTTVVFLPKIASDYGNITNDDLYFGGFAVLKLKKKENLIYRFGAYGSTEAFGFFTTPIIGWYYLSPNSKFEMDMSLPISADINYTFGKTTVGADYYGIGRSFNLTEEDSPNAYVDLSSLDFATYFQYNMFEKSVLLRGKFGYSSNNFEVYPTGQKIDLGLSAFSFGDERTQLNPKIRGGFFLKFEAIYRFNIPPKEPTPTTVAE